MSRTVSRGGSAKPSFQTAASQARDSQTGGGRNKASFTITRPADGASRVVVTTGAASASPASHSARQVTLRGEGSSSSRQITNEPTFSTVRRITIETSADSGRQVVRAGTKRRSGDMAASTGSGSGSGLSLRRTVINESAMDAEGGEHDDESAQKRGRFVIDNTSRPSAFAAPFATAPLSAPAPPPLLPGVQFSASLAAKVAQAAADRLAAAPPKTNAVMAATPLPSPAAASVFARGPLQSPSPSPSPASSPRPLTQVLLRNLSPQITGKFLLSHVFALYDVQRLSIDRDPETGMCAGTGEVYFQSATQAEEAVRLNQGKTFLMQPIRLSIIGDNEEPMQQMANAATAPTASVPQQSSQPQQPQQSPLSFRVPVGSTAPVAAQSKPVSASFPSSASTASAFAPAPVAPAPASSSSGAAAPAPTPSPLSHPLTNVGFVGVFGDPDAHMMDDEEETVFNITNLRGAGNYAAAAAPAHSHNPSASPGASSHSHHASSAQSSTHSAAPRPKVVQLRPKSVVVSGAEAMAGVASSKAKPSFTLARNATPAHSSSAESGWQQHQQHQQPPKTLVLNPRR